MKNNLTTKIRKGMILAIMLAIMVLTSNSLFAQSKRELLYKGKYIGGPSVLNGMSLEDVIGTYTIEIYENEIDIVPGDTYYFSRIKNGKRNYSIYGNPYNSQDIFADLLVDNDHNLTLYKYHPIGTEIKQYTKADSSPANTSQGSYNGGSYSGVGGTGTYTGGGNKPTSTPAQQKTHKCGVCGGTGRVVENNAVSFGNTKYCSECGKTVPDSHYHTTCPSCKGKGYW